jgi:uncharacterized protein YgfB (UPF0149 family)
MSTSPSLPTYAEVTGALNSVETPFFPAQVHGFICGLLCATSGKSDNSWHNTLLGDKKDRHAREMLQQIFESSFHLISEFSFEFTLLLPEDKASIHLRTEALGSWCQGFLAGLKHGRFPIENREPSEITDTLNDILEIAQVNYEELDANDEDEMAYFELLEYVRLAVLMIFHEIKTPSTPNQSDDGSWLH